MSLRNMVPIPRECLTPPVRDKADVAKAAVTLAQLAQHVLDSKTEVRPESFIAAVVRACCPQITSGSERMRLWAEYVAAVKLESDLLDGLIGYQQVDDSLTCIDRTQAAIDIAVERSRLALEALTGRAA